MMSVTGRIREYLRTLSPHVRKREAAVLLEEACGEIERLWRAEASRLLAEAERDYAEKLKEED